MRIVSRFLFSLVSLFLLIALSSAISAAEKKSTVPRAASPDSCLLFSYFVGNGEDGLHLAYSEDGFRWTPLNGGKALVGPKVGKERLMRDPNIALGPDGVFRMV